MGKKKKTPWVQATGITSCDMNLYSKFGGGVGKERGARGKKRRRQSPRIVEMRDSWTGEYITSEQERWLRKLTS